jgi:predicted nucleic acid-binding Zn ribbon protein
MAIEPIPLRRDDVDHRPPGMIGRELDRVLAGLGAPPAPVLTRIAQSWADLVGPAAAEHSRPGRLVDGRLHVEVDDPAWASQMRWQATTLLARIDDLVPGAGVTEVVTRVRPR